MIVHDVQTAHSDLVGVISEMELSLLKDVSSLKFRAQNVEDQFRKFHNLLTSVMVLVDYINRQIRAGASGLNSDVIDRMDVALKRCIFLQNLIQDVIHNRRPQLDAKVYDIREILDHFVKNVEIEFKSRLDFRLSQRYDGSLRLDRSVFLDMVLYELVQNAYRVCSGRAQIEIQTYFFSEYLRLSGKRLKKVHHPNDLVVVFKDTCGGIPEQVYDHYFEFFFDNRVLINDGIGLKKVQEVVTKWMDGDIALENFPGLGLHYHILIPA